MKRFLLLLLVICLVSNFSAYGQSASFTNYNFYDFDFLGGGARAEGMGKAFYALSDDINGVSWNPAGIFELEYTIIGLSWSSLNPKGKSTTDFINLNEANHSGSFSDVSSFSFASPVRVKGHPFVFSFSYTKNFDIFEQFDTFSSGEIIDVNFSPRLGLLRDTIPFTQEINNVLHGGLYTINFGFGTRFLGNISMGASVNVYAGHSIRKAAQMTTLSDVRYFDLIQRGFLEEDITVVDSNKFSGVNFTVGFKHNGDKMDLGLIVKTKFSLKANREEAIYAITSFNDLVMEQGTDTIYIGDLQLKYEIPMIIGAGIGYKVNENLIVAADVEYRGFKGKKILNRESITINPGGANEETFSEIDPGWKNVFTFRLGSEYLQQTGIGEIPIRAGFGFIPTPDPNTDYNTSDTTLAVAYNITFGTGIHWEQIHFDFSYSYYTLTRNYNMILPTETIGYVPFDTEFRNKNHHFGISFTGVF